jgi:hypothetical protein
MNLGQYFIGVTILVLSYRVHKIMAVLNEMLDKML